MEAMRVLKVVRRGANRERTAAVDQLRALVATGPEDLRDQLRGLSLKRLIQTTAAFRPGTKMTALAATKLAMRALA